MAYRKFTDRDGRSWEVRDRYASEWGLIPVGGNPGPEVRIRVPGYEKDPYELSAEELQKLLDEAGGRGGGPRKPSPFTE